MSDTFALEKRKEFEGQKEIIKELHKSLEDAEFKLIEGEKLRKKLHNTILVIFKLYLTLTLPQIYYPNGSLFLL